MRQPTLLLLLLLLPQPLWAFLQTTTDDGKPIYWTNECVVYHINELGPPDLADKEGTFAAIRQSFQTWNNVTCSYLRMVDGGFTDITKSGDNDSSRNLGINVLIWREKGAWPHQKKVIALTSILFNPDTGVIADTDIELNSDFSFSVGDENVKIDVQNTVTHELGHTIGLDHSTVIESTMFASAPLGEIKKRTLESDDIDGICQIYPIAQNPNNCDLSNVGFISATRGTSSCIATRYDPPTDSRAPRSIVLLLVISGVCIGLGKRHGRRATDSL